jgi:hypothetical protein
MAQTSVLLGDPYTKLGIPTNYPYVTATSPADGETGVILDETVQIQFSKPVDPDTVSLSGLPDVGGNPAWNDEFTAVAFSHGNLSHGQTYQLTVDVDDNLGNPLGDGPAPSQWSFVASTDNIPPSVTLSVRQDTVGETPVETLVILTFDDIVRTDTLAYSTEPNTPGRIYWNPEKNEARFRPDDGFTPGKQYKFTVTAVKDGVGKELARPVSIEFTVAAQDQRQFLPVIMGE